MRWRGVHILKKLRFLNSLNESSKVVVLNRCAIDHQPSAIKFI